MEVQEAADVADEAIWERVHEVIDQPLEAVVVAAGELSGSEAVGAATECLEDGAPNEVRLEHELVARTVDGNTYWLLLVVVIFHALTLGTCAGVNFLGTNLPRLQFSKQWAPMATVGAATGIFQPSDQNATS